MIRRAQPIVLLAIGLGLIAFFFAAGLTRDSIEGVPDFTTADITFTLAFAMFLPMGAFVAAKRPENPIGWIACGIGLVQLVSGAAYEYALRAIVVSPGKLPWGPEMAWVSAWTWAPGFALVALLCLLFPTGTLPGPRWKWVGWTAVATTTLLMVALWSLWPERGRALLFSEDPTTPLVPASVIEVAVALLFASLVASFASIIVRFRHSSGVERQQLKWIAFVAVIAAVLILSTETLSFIGYGDTSLGIVVENLLNSSGAALPIAVTIAVLRYRLFEIDLIINRTLVYGALTAVLAGTYVGLVFLLQRGLSPVTQESDLAIAASTLAVAALFRPARARIQDFIDRRFYRRKFDAQRTLEEFSGQLRDEVDLGALSFRLTAVVADTMQPAHLSLWIRQPERDVVTIPER